MIPASTGTVDSTGTSAPGARSSLRAFGSADCSRCPLGSALEKQGEWSPVPEERHDHDLVAVVAEAPGEREVALGRPLVGASGKVLQDAIDAIGVRRDRLRLTNVLACRPPGNLYEGFLTKLHRKNRERRGEGKAELTSPVACCRSRLLDDIRGFSHVLCLGGAAARSLRGEAVSIDSIRGSCEERPAPWDQGKTIRLAYTIHPARTFREPELREVFERDVAKAFRFFKGTLDWQDPEYVVAASFGQVQAELTALALTGRPVAFDVETTEERTGALTAKLLCIGFSDGHTALVVPWRRRSDRAPLLGASDPRVSGFISSWLARPPARLIGHNAGQFDRLVLERELGVTPRLAADTLLLHLLADNDRPHRLGFVGGFHTDFPRPWKSDHRQAESQDDDELYRYNADDCAVTAALPSKLHPIIKARKQGHLLAREHLLQDIGVQMQRNGLRVDMSRAREVERAYEEKQEEATEVLRAATSDPDFNPNSHAQVARLLFDKWGLAPRAYSEKTGEPSTDDETLRDMLINYDLDDEQRAAIKAERRARYYTKLLGTNVRPLRPVSQGGIVLPDGRVHPSYHRLPSSGRYSSGDPMNAQNVTEKLRELFIPADGCAFVAADADQLELRLIAEEARATRLIGIFRDSRDPHNETMEAAYGDGIWKLEGAPTDRNSKGSGVFKKTRATTKNTRYAWQYGAGVERVWTQVTSAEDDDGELIYAHVTKDSVRELCEKLAEMDPEIPAWWEATMARWRRALYLEDSIWHRRRDFKGKHERSDLVNHPIQAGGFHIVAEGMIDLLYGVQQWFATRRLPSRGPWPRASSFGARLITQTHDSLLFEAPEGAAQDFAHEVTKAMTRARGAIRGVQGLVIYTAEAKIGHHWGEV